MIKIKLKISSIAFFMTLCSLLIVDNLYSQNDDRFGEGPQLDGHDFIVNNFIKSPFLLTKLKTNLGFASSIETEIPLIKNDSVWQDLKIKSDITYLNGLFEFQYAVKNWAAIWLNISALARLGTNTPSLLAAGITANTSFETGMLFKVLKYDKMLLSSSFKISNSGSTIVNIFPYIRSLLDSSESVKLMNSFNPLSGSVDLRMAYAPGKKWSIIGNLEGGYGETVGIDAEEKFFTTLAATINYNLGLNSGIPLSFGTGIKYNSNSPTLEDLKQWTQSYMLQIAYSGKRDFLLSLEATYLRIPTKYFDLTQNLTSVAINWTYYF